LSSVHRPDRDGDTYFDSHGRRYSDCDAYRRRDSHSDPNQCNSHGDPDQRDAYGYTNLERRSHRHADHWSYSHGDGDRHSAAERSSDADFGRKRYVRTRSDG